MTSGLRKVKEKILKNELIIGTVVTLNDPEVTDILCSCGFDFIWIDAEHGPLDKAMINTHIMAVRGWDIPSFVRVPCSDPMLVKPILDMGPTGIIFPLIKTAKEAKIAVEACRYPPRGIRGFGPRRANNFSKMNMENYLKLSEKEPFVIIQIEHIEAVNNLKEILNVEGVDYIAIGPNDLSGSVGLLGQTDSPKIVKILDKIIQTCQESNIIFFPSIGSGNIDTVKYWINKGTRMIALDVDIGYLSVGANNTLKIAKKIFKDFLK